MTESIKKITFELKHFLFDSFQAFCMQSAMKPIKEDRDLDIESLQYCTIGLCGEAGEFAEGVKKLWRHNDNKITPEIKQKLQKELGDVLFYLSQLASCLGVDLSEIARSTVEKINGRIERGTLKGSGDDR